jgi:hypothetical protein
MEALARLLTRERLLVELLVFKLVELRQLLLAGETRFLGWASEEVERATSAVRTTEVERAVLVQRLGEQRGIDEPSLRELIEDAPEPWQGLLTADFDALAASAREVNELLTVTRRLAEAGSRSIAESLGTVPTRGGYAAAGVYGPAAAAYAASRGRGA